MDLEQLLPDLYEGRTVALARAISIVENARPGFERLLAALHPRLGRAQRIGITGPPGAGKSTLTRQLVQVYRARGLSVAVVAVDPTSPHTGGALLGDRIRMEAVALDQGVFIRSMATRGSLGGLATTTREVCDVLDAGRFDRILIETVGVGQSELAVGDMADSTVLVLVPESGDGIQTLKSGVMEIADVYVVNKADRSGAEQLAGEIEVSLGIRQGNAFRGIRAHHGLTLGAAGRAPALERPAEPERWEPPVLLTVATQREGAEPLVDALERHHAWMAGRGELETRRRERLARRTREVVERAAVRWVWRDTRAEAMLGAGIDDMASGRVSPYELAASIVSEITEGAAR